VVVYTGHPKCSGTTAKIFIIISGSRDETEPRALLDSTNTALKPGGVDTFILSVPSSLGKLDHVRIWHDNSGESASWYLNRILVRDVQTDRKTWFLCDQWFAVEEDDGLIERVLPAATKDDLVSFNFLFSIEARRKLFDEHLWFSVLSRRPRSQFTRVQRLSCCLAVSSYV
jgi:polycystin 1L2